MGYQALYRAWRPETFSDVVGQEPIVRTLKNQIESGRIAHAYLFCGSRGTGKTTMAKIFARAVNCMSPADGSEPCGHCEACIGLSGDQNMDVLEIDAASNNGVDEIRDLREKIKYPPSIGRYKVYIIDEVHMLSSGAFNALLKTLEEPPEHALFILATTEPNRLPETILSRCQLFDFKRILTDKIVERLKQIVASTGQEAEENALDLIARSAEGGMRDAISLLDMCLSYAQGLLTAAIVRQALGTSDAGFLHRFTDALMTDDMSTSFRLIDQVIRDGRDPAVFAREVLGELRNLMILQYAGDQAEALINIPREDAARIAKDAGGYSREKLIRAMDLFIAAENDMKWFSGPRSVLELAVFKCATPERELSLSSLTERVDKLERVIREGVAVRPAAKETVDTAKAPAETPAPAAVPEAKPAKAPEPAPAAAPAPDAADKAKWDEGVNLVGKNHSSMRALVEACRFAGREGAEVIAEIPKNRAMYKQLLSAENRKTAIESCMTEAFGEPMRLKILLEGENRPMKQPDAPARDQLLKVYEAFGRENVEVIDSE